MNSAALRFLILVTVLFCPTQTFFLYTRSYFQLPWATSLRGHKARADDHNNRGINAKSSDNLRSELPRRLNSNDVAVPKLIADAFRVNQKKGWSTSDMEQLIAMREQDVGWDEIARNLFRSVNSCQVKYYNYLKTQSWNSAEHKRLLFFTVIHKEDWKTIGKELDRLPDYCRLYYLQYQRNLIANGPWTAIENETLRRLCAENTCSFKEEANVREYDTFLGVNQTELTTHTEFTPDLADRGSGSPLRVDFSGSNCFINWRNVSHELGRTGVDCRQRYCEIVLGRNFDIIPDIWYESETKYLHQLVASIGHKWNTIARELGRNPMQCYNNYHTTCFNFNTESSREHSISGRSEVDRMHFIQRSKTWGADEDRQLLELVDRHGKKWKKIGLILSRTNVQCFQRYQILSVKGPKGWTEDQYKELHELVSTMGPKWTQIANMLGRTAYVCRSAYKRLIEKHNIARWSSFNNTINGKASTDRFQMPMANRKYRKHSLYPWLQSDNMHTSVMNYGSAVFNETDSETDLENILVMGSSSNYGLSYQLDQYEEVWQPTFPISGILQRLRYHELVPLLSPFGIATEYGENYEALSPQRIWNRKEDNRLRYLVSTYGRKWTIIAELMNRSPEDVMLRYDFKVGVKSRRSGAWTRDEDRRLLELVEEIGFKWTLIGEKIGRTGTQCSMRYRQSLDPRLQWRLWSADEDAQLVILRDDLGYNWPMISVTLNRAGPSCRYRYLKLKSESNLSNKERQENSDHQD